MIAAVLAVALTAPCHPVDDEQVKVALILAECVQALDNSVVPRGRNPIKENVSNASKSVNDGDIYKGWTWNEKEGYWWRWSVVKKSGCQCSDNCSCGCNEGLPCQCDKVASRVVPTTYRTNYAPTPVNGFNSYTGYQSIPSYGYPTQQFSGYGNYASYGNGGSYGNYASYGGSAMQSSYSTGCASGT